MNNTTETTTTIRYYQEDTKCQCCGKLIKNVVEIGGVQYGTTCASYHFPRLVGKKIDFKTALLNQAASDKKAMIEALATFVLGALPANHPEVNEFAASTLARDSKKYIYWLAYQEWRKLTAVA